MKMPLRGLLNRTFSGAIALLFGTAGLTAAPTSASGKHFDKFTNGIRLPLTNGILQLEVCDENIIRVAFATNSAFFKRRTLATEVRKNTNARWTCKSSESEILLSTAKLNVRVDRQSGLVKFYDQAGNQILAERERTLSPAEVQSKPTFHLEQKWETNAGEALYGLGQHQLGRLNICGYDLNLWQHNGTITIPFLTSSRGYGILWDNLSHSKFGDTRPFEPIPAAQLYGLDEKPGGLTGSYFKGANFNQHLTNRVDEKINFDVSSQEPRPNELIHPALPPTGDISGRWEGWAQPEQTGDYQFQTYSCGDIKLWVDDQLVIHHWRQGWLPWYDLAKVRLEAGKRHRLKLEWSKDQGVATLQLRWKTPSPDPATSLWSEAGDGIDYYFVHGPELDQVITGYRQLTGRASLLPLWAYGYWQSRERYQTAKEILDVLEEFRNRQIPIDNIVQDWRYWKLAEWGSHRFDPERFPHPTSWISTIHDKYHARLMLSVWGKFYPGTENFEAMRTNGYLFEGTLQRNLKDWLNFPYAFYDAFNENAGKMFWAQINRELFSKGVDAWWMDATEPDIEQPMPTLDGQRELTHPNAAGTGAEMLNGYALANSRTIYNGQRAAAPDQRVCILTRSAFAGQQRYAAAVWSGDISSTWTALQKQIPAGLGYALSGMPYWTTDIGGFAVPNRWNGNKISPEDLEEWRELYTRWFQFGTFCPLFRSHGQTPLREPWHIAPATHSAYQTIVAFDQLRYRLLPYIYSAAHAITDEHKTMMRPLIMDFPGDTNVLNLSDEFLFGPALLVSPVTSYQTRTRQVYLPATPGGWYDFWTGNTLPAGQTVESAAPYESIPIHVRAGSIIPCGPQQQYTAEHPADPITLFIYEGADGNFSLREDDGLTYDYEKGKSSCIPFAWNQAKRTLLIGKREGAFPGQLKRRKFDIILTSKDKPTAIPLSPKPDRSATYDGKAITLKFD